MNDITFNFSSIKASPLYKFLGLLTIWVLVLLIWPGIKAHATITLNPDPGSTIPSAYRTDLMNCDSNVPLRSPAFAQWVSASSDRSTMSISVPYGTASITPYFNLSAAVCSNRSAVTDTRYQVTGASSTPAGVSNIVGDVLSLNFNPPDSLGLYRESLSDFTYAPSGGFTTSGNYTIEVKTKGVNRFTSGTFLCIGGAGIPTTSLTDIGPCQETTSTFTIWVDVQDRPPTISLTASCTNKNFILSVSDPDGSPVSVRYQINSTWSAWHNVSGSETVDMSTYSQYDIHSIFAETNGVLPSGGAGSIYKSASTAYGNGGTRACLDRSFTANATASQPVLLPNDDDPQRARFDSSVTADIQPTSGPGVVQDLTLVRNWFIRKPGGIIVPLSTPAGNVLIDGPGTNSATRNPLLPTPSPGDEVCNRVYVTPASGTIDTVGNIISGSGNSTESESCTLIVSKPYFRVYNSDTAAGVNSTCTGWTTGTGRVIGYNDGTGKGSAVQLAIFALNGVNEVTSATGRSSAPIPPKGLTFANTGGTYGNPFGAGFCAPDYFATKSGTTIPLPLASVDISSAALPSGSYEYTGDVTVASLLPVPNGKKIVIYVTGNAYIASNIAYNSPWLSLSDIPNFALVVKGNIYIDKNVTSLDGFYVAQPNGPSEGEVFNCAVAPFTAVSTGAQLYTDCNKQLKINGAMVAKRIRLQRTKDSMKFSSNTEPRTSTTAAEQFIFGPEVWLNPALNTGSNTYQYDSITSLAPVL